MNRVPRLLLPLLVTACAGLFAVRALAAESDPLTPEEVRQGYRSRILLAKPRVSAASAESVEAAERLKLLRVLTSVGGLRTLETDGHEDVRAIARRLAATGLYEYVEPDYIRVPHVVPNDARFASDQWSLSNTDASDGKVGADIKAPEAWELQRNATDVIVAVLDTGVRLTHEDIAANLWMNSAEAEGKAGVDDDTDSVIDDVHGINAIVTTSDPLAAGDPTDKDGHGSHVAGIIGAVANNQTGIAGVAWKTQIMSLKFMEGDQGGSVALLTRCIDYAIKHGAKIINASFGGSEFSQAEYDSLAAARDAGIIIVASAGNDATEIADNPTYPAAYLLDNIVAVASTTRQDTLASYSTYGSGLVELAAPGSSILSLGITSDQAYVFKSGTSMAAPHVTGALALLRQKFPQDTYRASINRLLSAVDILPALQNRVQTNGRLNLLRALSTTDARPYNDDFARRATIVGVSNKIRGSNQYATAEPDEPAHATAATGTSIWWQWTAPAAVAKLNLNTFGSNIDTVLAVYQGDSLGTLRQIASNDDYLGINVSSLSVEVTPGQTYCIAVAGKGAAQGAVMLSLSTSPANDAFASAQEIAGESVNVVGNNAGATTETGEPKLARSSGSPSSRYSVWYKWTAPATGHFQVSVSADVIDPVVGVFTGSSLSTLVEVASNDDSSATLIRYDSLAGFSATKGTVYYLKVDAASGEGGEFLLTISDALWQALAMIAGMTTPALGEDGTIYYVDIWGILYAFQSDGTKKWVFTDTEDTVTGGGPAIAPDGAICFGDDSGFVYAVRRDGTKKWSFATGGPVWAAPAVGADGTLYVKSDDGYLYALAADGTKKWTYPVLGETYSAPTIAPDGTIYIAASGDKALYALTPGGSRKWRFDMGAETYASPALGSDGVLYVGNYDGRFFAIKPDGTEKWHFDTKSPLSASAVLDSRGYVYFGSYDTKLYALDAATGAEKWEYATGDVIRGTAPAVGSDGTIFIGGDDGLMHAVNGEGKRLRTYAVGSGVYGAPALIGGRLYVPTYDAKIVAFGVGVDASRNSPWPMHRHNVRRLGRAVDLGGVPFIVAEPVSATAKAGQSVTFSVRAVARDGQLAYQWQFNNAPISGATNASYTVSSVTAGNAGAYSVIVTGSAGWTPSAVVTLTIDTGTSPGATQLVNFSLRGFAGTSDRTLIVGFNADGPGSKKVYVRGIGGAKLASFGVASPLADPTIQVLQMLSASTVVVTSNDNWSGDDGRSAGGFELTAGSKDAVVSRGFPAGTYTAQLTGVGGGTGEAMVEIYDGAQSDAANRLTNVSARTELDTGRRLIVGFATVGAAKRIVIRGIGPALKAFGLDTAHTDPRIELYDQTGKKIAENDDWSGDDGHDIGGFQLTTGSKDAVISRTLEQGNYYVHVLSAPGTSGVVLVEAYLAP